MKSESADHSRCWIWSRHVYSWRICRVLASLTTNRYCTQEACRGRGEAVGVGSGGGRSSQDGCLLPLYTRFLSRWSCVYHVESLFRTKMS